MLYIVICHIVFTMYMITLTSLNAYQFSKFFNRYRLGSKFITILSHRNVLLPYLVKYLASFWLTMADDSIFALLYVYFTLIQHNSGCASCYISIANLVHTRPFTYSIAWCWSFCFEITSFYASSRPINGTGGIMFSGCPSVCACVCLRALSDRLAVDL